MKTRNIDVQLHFVTSSANLILKHCTTHSRLVTCYTYRNTSRRLSSLARKGVGHYQRVIKTAW